MSHAILVSDNDVINSLYEVNLRAYVGTNVTVKPDLKSASQLIEHAPNVDAVICFRELNKKNAIDDFFEFLSARNYKIPLIVLGEPDRPLNKALIIKNKYDIQSLLRAMAKILNITAKDMADKIVPDYFPIPIKLFSSIDKFHCDIFYRTEKGDYEFDYYVIIEKGTYVGDKLHTYFEQGIEHLFIDANERLRFINKASGMIVEELTREDLSTGERLEITRQGMEFVASEISENEVVTEEIAQISKACAKSIAMVAKAVPGADNLLTQLLESKAEYVYMHSVLTAYIAGEIIKNISWGSKEQQEKVAFSLFFHDIYLVPIYKKYPDALSEEDLLFREDLTEAEKEVVIDHAKLAGQFLKTFPQCPIGADMIVTQHHGMTNGQGFAVSFKDDISPLAKIMIIAEEVTTTVLLEKRKNGAFKMNVPFRDKMAKVLAQKFKNHSYRKIVDGFSLINF